MLVLLFLAVVVIGILVLLPPECLKVTLPTVIIIITIIITIIIITIVTRLSSRQKQQLQQLQYDYTSNVRDQQQPQLLYDSTSNLNGLPSIDTIDNHDGGITYLREKYETAKIRAAETSIANDVPIPLRVHIEQASKVYSGKY